LTGEPNWLIRRLGQGDLPLYTALRLRALCDHPAAFGSSYEEEASGDLARMIGDPPSATLGAFVGGEMAGTAAVVVSPRIKQRHKGQIVAVYLAPAFRRTGLARALMDALVMEARSQDLVVLTLSVTVGNETARRLYLSAGFTTYGVEPAGLRIGDDFLDDELMALRLR
jgi:ribosomal protein S18 acetylase RimI-like enzyme